MYNAPTSVKAMLEVDGLESGYGPIQALFGMSFTCQAGRVTSLIGRNGMGKTTTVSSIMGTLTPGGGSVRFAGEEIAGQPAYAIAQLGIGLVPEGRQVFP